MKETANSLIPRHKKIDISSEQERTYVFPGSEIVKIVKPKYLIISDNGHRIYDEEGISHYIPIGWIHLWWKNSEDRKVGFLCETGPPQFKPENSPEMPIDTTKKFSQALRDGDI